CARGRMLGQLVLYYW
nr:immunoglobulin heavy chain junction region [Macaca mulatta]